MLILPIILLVLALTILFSSLSSAFSVASQGGVITYDEETFQDYADAQYAVEFGSSTAYEDNLLIVFLTNDDYYDYAYIAWLGDHLVTKINLMFGNEYTEFGRAVNACVNSNSYKYSLDSNLAQVIETMEEHIVSAGLESSFSCKEDHAQVTSHLTNKTNISMTEETVNTALQSFTEATGIPAVIVVDTAENVFGKQMPASTVVTIVIAAAVLILAVVLIVRAVRKRGQDGEDYDDRNGSYR